MSARIEEIKRRLEQAERGEYYGSYRVANDDIAFLLAEVERLRSLLERVLNGKVHINELREALEGE